MNQDDQHEKDQQEKKSCWRIVHAQHLREVVEPAAIEREDDEHACGGEPEKGITLFQLIAPHQFDNRADQEKATQDGPELNAKSVLAIQVLTQSA